MKPERWIAFWGIFFGALGTLCCTIINVAVWQSHGMNIGDVNWASYMLRGGWLYFPISAAGGLAIASVLIGLSRLVGRGDRS